MDCKLCNTKFCKANPATVLECGHSLCLNCIKALYLNTYKCPYDQISLTASPKNLSPNYALMELIEENQKHSSKRSNWTILLIFLFLAMIIKLFLNNNNLP